MTKVIWEPQAGSQVQFMTCPAFECLFHGSRGNGKTDALLMDFAQHVGQGWGVAWRGIIFRQTIPALEDLISKSKKWFPLIFPDATYNKTTHVWQFKTGETLKLAQFRNIDDYQKYHGHEYAFIGWEELTNWASSDGYEAMITCCRSSTEGVILKIRATCNPLGPGHHWVKNRFIDPSPDGKVFFVNNQSRVAIRGRTEENRILLKAQPDYIQTLMNITDENKRSAWYLGSWDIVSGCAISSVWTPSRHILRPFKIPPSWTYCRSYDYGYSAPFSVGWWAISDGTTAKVEETLEIDYNDTGREWGESSPIEETLLIDKHYQKGTYFRIAEYYGASGPNKGVTMQVPDVAKEILRIEERLGIKGKIRRHNSIADASIFDAIPGAVSIARQFENSGVVWSRSEKKAGSRKQGLDLLRSLLYNSIKFKTEKPGLYIFDTCRDWIRTVPTLPMDSKDIEDVDTNGEDHIYDETRYMIYRADKKLHKVRIGQG
jgi:hypothetical protein